MQLHIELKSDTENTKYFFSVKPGGSLGFAVSGFPFS